MSVLPTFPTRLRIQAVIVERRGTMWATGIGSLVQGAIERELQMHGTQAVAEAAALALADDRDMLAVRD